MKKYLILRTLITLTILAEIAYPQSDDIQFERSIPPLSYINLSPNPLLFSSSGGTDSIFVLSNINWNVTENLQWITQVTPSSGSNDDTLLVTCSQNASPNSRSGYIVVANSSGNTADSVLVIQDGAPGQYLIVDPDAKTVSSSSGSFNAYVFSNTSWSIYDTIPWVTCTPPSSGSNNDTVLINYTANTSSSSRSGVLKFQSAGLPDETIFILQTGVGQTFLIVDPDNKTVSSSSGSFNANVQSNTNWTISDTIPWITCNPQSGGSNNMTVVINYTANTLATSRSGALKFQAPGLPDETIFIVQTGVGQTFLIVDPDNKTVSSGTGSFNANVQSNTSWTILDTIPWITCNPQSGGSNNMTVVINYSANTLASSRSGTLKFQAAGLPDETIFIVQTGVGQTFLIVDPDSKTVSSAPGSFNANVQSNTTWTILDTIPWVTCNPQSGGSNNMTVIITYTANTSPISRSGTLKFQATGLPDETIFIAQTGIGQNFLIVDPDNKTVSSNQGNFTANVQSNTNWTILDTIPWVTCNPSTGGSGNMAVTVNYNANSSPNSRSGTLKFQSSGLPDETIFIVQTGLGQTFLIVDPDNKTISSDAGSFTADVQSNTNWTIADTIPWVTCNPQNGGNGSMTIVINYSANPLSNSRSGTLKFQAAGLPDETIFIVQVGLGQKFLIVDPDSKTLSYTNSVFNAIVQSNADWSIIDTIPWITCNPPSGSNNATVAITYQTNNLPQSRSGTLKFQSNGLPDETILIVQNGIPQNYLIVDPVNKLVLAAGGNYSANVFSNLNWQVSTTDPWLTNISPSSGNGNGGFTFSCSPNSMAESREGEITVSASGVPSAIINVLQYGQGQNYLIVDPDNQTVLAAGDNFIATVYSNIDWIATPDQEWISVDTSSNRDLTTFKVTCDPNTELSSRVGHVFVTGGSFAETIEITQFGQSGNFLYVSPMYPNLSYQSGSIEFSVTSNVDWEVTTDAPWITGISPSSGNGNEFFTVNYQENPVGQERQAFIAVASEEIIANITLTQDGNGATVSVKGRVKDGFNAGIPGVTVSFISQSGVKTVETNASGNYELIIKSGRTGSVRPEKEGMIFSPAQKDYADPIITNQNNVDFTGGFLQILNLAFEEDSVVICKDESDTLNPIITGATSSAIYSWTSNPPGFTSNEIKPVVNPQVNTYYILSITDINASVKDSILYKPKDLPAAKNILGITQVCRNQAGLIYIVDAHSNDEIYAWQMNSGGTIIYGANSYAAVVNWGDSPGIYELTLNTFNFYGCSSSKTITIQVTDYSAPPFTVVEDKSTDISCILICMDTTADHYRWGYTNPETLADSILENKTDRFCEVPDLCGSLSHNYWVETWYDNNSCVSRSYHNFTAPVGVNELPLKPDLIVFPNPAHHVLNIALDNSFIGNIDFILFNSVGVNVLQEKFTKSGKQFSMSLQLPDIKPGFYILVLRTYDSQISKKLIIN